MATQIQLRRDLAANWTASNPTLAQGEMGLELDTINLKLGDGITAWNALPYYNPGVITDHSALSNLTYATSGHTGFQEALSVSTGLTLSGTALSLGGTTSSAITIQSTGNSGTFTWENYSNSTSFAINRNANGTNIFSMTNTDTGASASSSIRMYNDLGITTQLLNTGSGYTSTPNSFIFHKVSGDTIFANQSGTLYFRNSGFPGTIKARIDSSGVSIGDTSGATFYILPTARGNANDIPYENGSGQLLFGSLATIMGYTAENSANKVTSLSSSSTDVQYPSAKVTYDSVQSAKAFAVAMACAL